MYQDLGMVALRSGEQVMAGVVHGPDRVWAARLVKLLWHKGDPWNWQNAQLLEREHGVDAFFYVLHRDGRPFANIMTVEYAGVGLFGHVWTEPADRQQGASSALMALQMQDFQARGGEALFLGTEYASIAYQMYARFGFQSVEAQSGYMAYYRADQADFTALYFAPPTQAADLVIQPLDWPHWPAAAPLFLGNFPGVIRCVRAGLFGRASAEGGLLPLLLEGEARRTDGEAAASVVLCKRDNGALLGLATYQWHPLWPESYLLDLYCHPQYWSEAQALLEALHLPVQPRAIAYVDHNHQAKAAALAAHGFQPVTTLPQWLAALPSGRALVDVVMWVRS